MPLDVPQARAVPTTRLPDLQVEDAPEKTTVRGEQFSLVFDKQLGTLASLRFRERELLHRGPRFNIWRAPTENDLGAFGQEKAGKHWRSVGYDQLEEKIQHVEVEEDSSKEGGGQVVRMRVRSVLQVPEGTVLPLVETYEERLGMLQFGLGFMLNAPMLDLLIQRMQLPAEIAQAGEKIDKIKALIPYVAGQKRIMEMLRTMQTLLAEHNVPLPDFFKEDQNTVNLDEPPVPPVPARFELETLYTVYSSGDVVIDVHVIPGPNLPFLPRAGLQMALTGGLEQFTWYGRDPHETYNDRQEGAKVGVYSGSVDDQFVHYIVPEENGNKTDVRWVSLTGADGTGLLAVGLPLLNVSAHHFSTPESPQARHPYDLNRLDEIILNLDYGQSGLGSAACGPGRLEKYQLKAEEMHFSVRLCPFNGRDEPAKSLSNHNPHR